MEETRRRQAPCACVAGGCANNVDLGGETNSPGETALQPNAQVAWRDALRVNQGSSWSRGSGVERAQCTKK